jgi:hypothetical protein
MTPSMNEGSARSSATSRPSFGKSSTRSSVELSSSGTQAIEAPGDLKAALRCLSEGRGAMFWGAEGETVEGETR